MDDFIIVKIPSSELNITHFKWDTLAWLFGEEEPEKDSEQKMKKSKCDLV